MIVIHISFWRKKREMVRKAARWQPCSCAVCISERIFTVVKERRSGGNGPLLAELFVSSSTAA